MIVIKRADQLRPGDVLSTDGSRIETVVLLQGGGAPAEVCICRSWEAGEGLPSEQRFEYVEPSRPVYVFTADPS